MSDPLPNEDCPPPAWTVIEGQNSYVSLDDAAAIAALRLTRPNNLSGHDSTWPNALTTATALLDRMRWQGRPVAPTQPLAWPRVADRCPHGYPMNAPIPQAIKTACVELALHLLANGGQLSSAPVQSRMLGDSMTMYFPTIADELPKHVRRLIEPHLRASSANVAEVMF